jgi:endoglycosylceramidase
MVLARVLACASAPARRRVVRGIAFTALQAAAALCALPGLAAAQTCPAATYGTPQPAAAPLHADGALIKDGSGRAVLLRGVNATGDAKVPPFRTITSAGLLDPLPGWGINTLRLLFNWEAFEPTRCSYDASYLAYYEQVVTWARARNLYVIVDFHQDAYSRFTLGGCGEGFPSWAVASSVGLQTPKNDESCASWGAAMLFDTAHHATWSAFHKDTEGARTRFVEMARAVADRMSRHANVIGYELINEPWGTDTELHALYQAVGAAIRERDPQRMLFVPPHALVSSGMPDNNIPRVSFGNIVYSPHFYDPSVVILGFWWGNSPADPLGRMLAKAGTWNAPMLLGEYGANHSVGNVAGYIESLYTWLDANFVSGTQWNWTPGWTTAHKDGWNGENLSIVDGSNALRPALFVPRPYPQKTAGTPLSFARSGNGFTYSWTHSPALGETEVFLPAGYATGKVLSYPDSSFTPACRITGQKLVCSGTRLGKVVVALRAP